MLRRVFSAVGLLLLSGAAGILAAALLLDWSWILIRHATGDGHTVRIAVPIPLSLARIGVALAPEEAFQHDLPAEFLENRRAITDLVSELSNCPDALIVRVEDGETGVILRKEGGSLICRVDSPDAKVTAEIPLSSFGKALRRWKGDRLDRATLMRLLTAARGTRVRVDADDADVYVKI